VDPASLVLACAVLPVATAQLGREPVLRRVEEEFSDRDPLASSLRQIDTDLREPAGFNALYQVEGKEIFVRRSGALWAVFPRGRYTRHDGKTIVQAPAGMTFSIGPPSALLEPPNRDEVVNPRRVDLALPFGGAQPTEGARLDRRLDHSAGVAGPPRPEKESPTDHRLSAGRATLDAGASASEGAVEILERPPSAAPSTAPSPVADPPPRFLSDEPYRRERLEEILRLLRGSPRPAKIGE